MNQAARDHLTYPAIKPVNPVLALTGLALTTLISSLGTSIANIGLPVLTEAFKAPVQQVQWVLIAYLLAMTSLVVSMGRLGDIYGHKRLLLAGLAGFIVASLACGSAPTLEILIGARLVQGGAAAAMMALTIAMVGATVPKEQTGRAMGLLGTMSAIGTALGPSLGGLLITTLSWRFIFYVNLPLGLLALWLAWRHLPAAPANNPPVKSGFDLPGSLLLAASLSAYALAMTTGHDHFGTKNLVLLVIAVFGAAAFILVETRVPAPLVNLRMLQRPQLSAGFVMSMLVAAVMMATLVVGPFYLGSAFGLSTRDTGLLMSCGPIISAVTANAAGRLVDKFGSHRITLVGLTAMLIGCTTMAYLDGGILSYMAPLIITTLGYASFQVANNTAVMASADTHTRGTLSGLLNLARNLGLITGASLMGVIYAVGSASAGSSSAGAIVGMHCTFTVASAFIALALLTAAIAELRQKNQFEKY